MSRRAERLAFVIVLAAVVAGAVVTWAQSGTVETDVRINARLNAERDRIEFALQQRQTDGSWSDRMLPSSRFLPATLSPDRWLNSSPVSLSVDVPEGPQLGANQVSDGKHEIGVDIAVGTYETTVPSDTICYVRRYLPDGTYIGNFSVYDRTQEVPLQSGQYSTIEVTTRFTYFESTGGCVWTRIDDSAVTPSPQAGATRSNPVSLGEQVRIGEWQVRVLGATRDAWPVIQEENRYNDPPEDGWNFFMVEVEVTYLGDGVANPRQVWLEFGAVGSGNAVRDGRCGVIPDELQESTELFTGGSVRGNVCFPVTSAEASEVDLVLQVKIGLYDPQRVYLALN